jgi:hypothetical protein
MAQYQRLPVPDYATGARNSAARTNSNLARLQQQLQVNAQRRVQNAQDISKLLQTAVQYSPTAAGLFKEQQLKADKERQANYEVKIKEAGITSQDYLKNEEDKKKLEDLGDKVDKMTYSLSAEKRDILNDIENPRDILWLKKYFAGEDMINMPSALIQAQDKANFSKLDTLGRQSFHKQFELDYITNTSIRTLDAATRKELKIYDQFSALFKTSTTKAAVTRTKDEKAERITLYNKELDNAINAKTGLAGEIFVKNINKKHLKYGGERRIYKNEDYNNLLIGITKDTFTRAEIDILLNSKTGLDEFKTLKEYLGEEKVKGIYDALYKREVDIFNEAEERNETTNKLKESTIFKDIVTTDGITPDEQKAILDVAIYELIKNKYDPKDLERLRDNLNEGTPAITSKYRALEKAYEINELTTEMVKETGNAYLINEWMSKAEKQENGRKTETYIKSRKSLETVFTEGTKWAYVNNKLTPATQGIVSQLQSDFDREYAKLPPEDPNSALQAAEMVVKTFKVQGGGTTDGNGLYSFDTQTMSFKNFLDSKGANFSVKDVITNTVNNNLQSLVDQGFSRSEIVNNDGFLLQEEQIKQIESTYNETGEWTPYLKGLSEKLTLPPWIIYNGQGGKKIKETEAAKTWKEKLSPKSKVSIMKDPSESTYTSIAYELSSKGINDVDLNMAIFGISEIPLRFGFTP